MNGHLAGQSHVADDLSSIVGGIDETICPYRTSCAAEVAQVLHLAVLPKEVVNLWRPRVCVNRVTLYKTFLRLDHGHSHTSPSYPVHPASPAGASHHAATRSRGLRQSQPTSQNPESKEDQRFWEMMTWVPDGLSPHGSDLPPAYCG
jgi:hypothetical protein